MCPSCCSSCFRVQHAGATLKGVGLLAGGHGTHRNVFRRQRCRLPVRPTRDPIRIPGEEQPASPTATKRGNVSRSPLTRPGQQARRCLQIRHSVRQQVDCHVGLLRSNPPTPSERTTAHQRVTRLSSDNVLRRLSDETLHLSRRLLRRHHLFRLTCPVSLPHATLRSLHLHVRNTVLMPVRHEISQIQFPLQTPNRVHLVHIRPDRSRNINTQPLTPQPGRQLLQRLYRRVLHPQLAQTVRSHRRYLIQIVQRLLQLIEQRRNPSLIRQLRQTSLLRSEDPIPDELLRLSPMLPERQIALRAAPTTRTGRRRRRTVHR